MNSQITSLAPDLDTHKIVGQQPIATKDTPYVEFWNNVLAEKFLRYKHILVDGLSHHSTAIFPLLTVLEGERVLDVGCGFGDTALILAQKVGSKGQVVGVDCCDAFLNQARELARVHQQTNLAFVRSDAEVALAMCEFDLVFSRFGTMFFNNPVNALRNLRLTLKPGGRFVQIVWREKRDNPWLSMALDVILRFVPGSDNTAASCGPGPFSLANEAFTRRLLQKAGFTEIEFKRIDAPVKIGNNIKDAINFQLAIGPAAEAFREGGETAEKQRGTIEAALTESLKKHASINNGLYMDSSSWVISAKNSLSRRAA